MSLLLFLLSFLNEHLKKTHFIVKIYQEFLILLLSLQKLDGLNRKGITFFVQKQLCRPIVPERAIEYPWILSKMQLIDGKVILDVGCQKGLPTTDILSNRNQMFGIDPNIQNDIVTPEFRILKGDIRSTSFSSSYFDLVLIISTLEHIGVIDRYNISEPDENGDIRAMTEIHRITKPGGIILGSVPYGKGNGLPLNRIYDHDRFQKITDGFSILEVNYFQYFDKYGLWLKVEEKVAEQNDWDSEPWYCLACFVLQKN